MALKKLISQMSRMLAALIGLALVSYIAYLVITQYRSQVAIQDASLQQLTSDSTRRATALGYFLSERKTDIKELAQSREVSAYFTNEALGMSMEYGLRASLIMVDDLFTKTRESEVYAGIPVFERIVFIDQSGALLADTLKSSPPTKADWKQYLNHSAGEQPYTRTIKGEGEVKILACAPVRFKGRYAGEVVGWISPSQLYHWFIESDGQLNRYPVALLFKKEFLRLPTQLKGMLAFDHPSIPPDIKPLVPYRLPALKGQSSEQRGYAILVPVEKTNVSLMAFIPGREILDLNSPRLMLYTTAGIAIFILGVLYYLQLVNTRNAVLQVRLEETTLREAAVDEKNRLLAAEVEERRQTELALRESEARFRAIVGAVPVIIYEYRQSESGGRSFTFVSDSIAELSGYPAEVTSGDTEALFGLIHPEDFDGVIAATDLAVANRSPFSKEFRIINHAGETRWILANSLPHPEEGTGATVWYGCLEDITDRKTADLSLRESRRQLEDIIDFLPDATLVVDREGRVVAWNRAIEIMTGVKAEEMIGKGNYEYALPFYGKRRPILIDHALNPHLGEQGYAELSKEAEITYGESFTPGIGTGNSYLAGSASVLKNSRGEVTAAIECIRDNTERLRAEQLLRESEATLRSLMDSMPAGVWWYDDLGKVEYLNSRFSELFGFKLEEISTIADWLRHAYPDVEQRKRLVRERQALIAEARLNGTPVPQLETMVTCRDGSMRHIIVNTQFAKGLTLEIFTDITEQEFIHNELLKVQKMESLGVLAGGIAHDFNNILTGVMGYVSLAQMVMEGTHEARPMLDAAQKASQRASELAHQLLTFARGGQPVKRIVSVPRLVEEALSLSLRGTSVQGKMEWVERLYDVEADAGQLNQAFNNIVINAVHAMAGGGTLSVRGENVQLEKGNKLGLAGGPYVKLTFQDQGCGIREGDLKNIFDPYFTTKSRGNGLGLASTLSIVRKHGGHIQVHSEVGVGTTFTFFLPATIEAAAVQETGGAEGRDLRRTGGTVLVMDDEEMIRALCSEMLLQLGYQVATCAEGAEAIALYRAAKEGGTPYFAVIMDLTIPGGMGGREAAQQIIAYDPAARLIVSSGYSNDLGLSDAGNYGFCGAVMKPYQVSDLAGALDVLQLQQVAI